MYSGRHRVTNAATGSVLTQKKCTTGRSHARLLVVRARQADKVCSTWTLVPGNDGTWTLADAGDSHTVRLLIP